MAGLDRELSFKYQRINGCPTCKNNTEKKELRNRIEALEKQMEILNELMGLNSHLSVRE